MFSKYDVYTTVQSMYCYPDTDVLINKLNIHDGVALKCYKLSYETDEAVFDDWALHIRKHYVEDDELTDDSVATGLSIEDYLREFRRKWQRAKASATKSGRPSST